MARAQILLLAGIAVALVLRSTVDFAMPLGSRSYDVTRSQRPPKRARDDLPRHVQEIPLEEPEAEELEKEPLPERRVPYTMNFFVHTDHMRDQKVRIGLRYMERKLQAALDNVQDWIQKVDVRLTIENHAHKKIGGRKDEREIDIVDEDGSLATETVTSETKRVLAPYRMEVTVKMHEGSVVLSKSKHAQPTFLEAVDHMHDLLRRQMRKEKEKRISQIRKQSAYDVMDDSADDDMQSLDDRLAASNAEWEAKLNREAAAPYADIVRDE